MDVGAQVPATRFKITSNSMRTFSYYRGSWLILYFYPKDATPGCTTEGCDFRDHEKNFSMYNAVILGVSRDSMASHERFKKKQDFPFDLISDTDEALCRDFGVIKTKSMYGKEVLGIERSSFLIDPKGIVRYVWRNVHVQGHVEEVLATLMSFQE